MDVHHDLAGEIQAQQRRQGSGLPTRKGRLAHALDARMAALMEGNRNRKILVGTLMTLAGGTFWGINGTLSKILMDSYAVDPLWLACVRELSSCWLFLAAAAILRPGRIMRAVRSPRALGQILITAIASILLSQVAYLEAINWTNSATATVLQSLECVLVMGFVCIVNRRLPRKRELAGLLLALVGVFLVATGGNPQALQLPPQGLAWGLMCAVAAAILAIQPVRVMHDWGNFVVNGLAFLMSGLILAVVIRPWSCAPTLDMRGVLLLATSVVVGTFGAYGLYLKGVAMVGSMRGSLLAQSEPVMATVTSVLWCGIIFSPADLAGFVFILAVVFLTS